MISAAAASAAGSFCLSRAARADDIPAAITGEGPVLDLNFTVRERTFALPCFSGNSLPLWTFQNDPWFPVVRVRSGQRIKAAVTNMLPRAEQHITVHWHGIRITNVNDGVAYLTQAPVQPGETGTYDFIPPDPGTYFFHTHCNSVEHFGRGLVGVLVVEGDETVRPDADIVLLMKDWRLGKDNAFLPFFTDEGSAKAGTAGTVRSINGITKPVYRVPAGADVRLRLLNVDPSRISEVALENAEAAVIAVDGNACTPIPLGSWRFGPANRLDILFRSLQAGETVRLVDYFAANPVVLAEFTSESDAKRASAFSPTPLKADNRAGPVLSEATRLPLEFSATATGQALSEAIASGVEIGALCRSRRPLWAINKQSWPSVDYKWLGPPIANLDKGRSYIFELKNLTPHAHPIHLHGHTFDVLNSNIRKIPPHRADTILLLPKERIEIALVADNPGRWMLHCHILEHQETGMMGYFNVA